MVFKARRHAGAVYAMPLYLSICVSVCLCVINRSSVKTAKRVIMQTTAHVSDVCLKRTCSLDTSTFRALEVIEDNRAV